MSLFKTSLIYATLWILVKSEEYCLFISVYKLMDLNFSHTIDIEQKLVSMLIESLLWPWKILKVIAPLLYCLQLFFKLSNKFVSVLYWIHPLREFRGPLVLFPSIVELWRPVLASVGEIMTRSLQQIHINTKNESNNSKCGIYRLLHVIFIHGFITLISTHNM